jgi:parvulin-like peptidyl-prolyl isomerase
LLCNGLRVRLLFCFNLALTLILASVCIAQAQPGAESGAAAASASKTNATPPDQRVVLKIGDQQITQAAFEQYLVDLEAQQGPATLSREKLGENYASMLVLSQQAVANNLESSPAVIRQLAIDRMQILSNAEFARLKAEATPTPEQIRAYYDEHGADFDLVQIRRIFIWPSAPGAKEQGLTPQQAQALAEAIHHAYTTGGDVDKVVNDTPHGKENVVVDKQPLTFERGELPPAMNKAVFALKEGEWTEFNNGPGTYAFIHVVKRSREDLADVTKRITKDLQNEKLRQELAALKSKTGVWMDEAYFATKSPVPASTTQPEPSEKDKTSTERGEK